MANTTHPADPDSSTQLAANSQGGGLDNDISARKRMEVGLSARRPTANSAPLRPPTTNSFSAARAVLPAFLGVIVLATVFLVAANIWDWYPSWWRAPAIVADPLRTVTAPLANPVQVAGYQMVLSDDFSHADTVFAEGAQVGKWRIEHQPTSSSYLMEVWPNRIVWSLLDETDNEPQRLQASVSVATHTPWGYAGLVNRYLDEENFYLFLVDGQGRYMVQLQQDGALATLQPWTKVDFLNAAGSTNTITIDDDGTVQRFYGNNMLLYETPSRLPAGDAGLVGGSREDGVAEISFDWIQLFDLLVTQ